MAGDKEEADNVVDQTVGVVVEMEEPPSSSEEEEVSSSEGSGVLVEAPPPPDEVRGTHPSDQKKLLVPFQPPPQPQGQQEQQQLSLFGTTTPKFHFYTNETKIPQQLNAIQQQSVRNRQAFQSRIHDVEIKIADLTARLANEEMDRQIDVKNAVSSCVHQPLQAVLEQITVIDQPTPSLTSRWIAAERNYSALDAKIYHGIHVELAEAKPSQKVDLAGLAVEIREESLVTAKKEGSVARRWETECGILARRYLEERTARIAALQLIGTTLNAVDQRRGQELLETIRELRRKLEVEKDERIASDESALDYIVKRTEAVKRAILEAYTDNDVYEDDFDI
jgi:citrate lyase gamma subunit